ncbi:site-specific DNA-methyltransferase [Halomonas colorata]|uniref:site-specific DNA-methyltransferase (adenine-specific) n=1 Tax=Halomonas colorata TaxID=2742615 RepID=A0ABR9FWT0_9GAMM|nr:site-specific DNA-methyltransferase [Halomonas colorata]MBE0463103.1 site-specific DNA-methyltransferase [Halomonas colorata]
MKQVKFEDGRSLDVISENIEKLKELFPDAFTEGGVNFDTLRQLLGDASVLDEGEEKYGLNWHGKKKARQIALAPSTGTLLPCPEESVDWDTTQNLFIEGDNLEVLKLLQKSYANQVKMIYIDPPYNTGKEFIYPDRFQENLDTYLKYTGQIDDEGMKFSSSTESHGRYHSNWLSMMYPRLKLAKSFLKSDGVIFISIDDHESANLQTICDEIFGLENFLGKISVVSNLKGRSDDRYFATAHNYLLAYQKGGFITKGVPLPTEYLNDYNEVDDQGRKYRLQGLRKRGSGAKREDRPNMYYPFYVNPGSGSISLEKSETFSEEVLPKLSDGTDGRWRWGKDTSAERINELTGRTVGKEKRWDVFQIDYAESEDGEKRIKPKSIWMGPEFSNEAGTLEVKNLIGKSIFDTPKPVGLIKYILEQTVDESDIVLDFFAGSATTAHAVLEFNKETKSRVRYICVQLPEKCEEKTDAYKSGFRSIAEIALKRIVNCSNEMSVEDSLFDKGVKVFRLSNSNILLWNPDTFDIESSLLSHEKHLIEGRSEQDILYELLLKRGVDLAVPIESREVDGKNVYSIGYGVLFAFLDESISREQVEDIAQGILDWHKELSPSSKTHVFFRDSAFRDDVSKTNMAAILEQNGISHVRSL